MVLEVGTDYNVFVVATRKGCMRVGQNSILETCIYHGFSLSSARMWQWDASLPRSSNCNPEGRLLKGQRVSLLKEWGNCRPLTTNLRQKIHYHAFAVPWILPCHHHYDDYNLRACTGGVFNCLSYLSMWMMYRSGKSYCFQYPAPPSVHLFLTPDSE